MVHRPGAAGGAAGLQSSGRLIGQSMATAIALWTAAGLTLVGACASGLRRV